MFAVFRSQVLSEFVGVVVAVVERAMSGETPEVLYAMAEDHCTHCVRCNTPCIYAHNTNGSPHFPYICICVYVYIDILYLEGGGTRMHIKGSPPHDQVPEVHACRKP